MTEEKFTQAISDALEGEKKRNFVESVDVAVNLKGVDLKDPNKIFDIYNFIILIT